MALTKVKPSNILLTTPSASSNDVTPATTAYVTTAIANMVDSAPSTLNTLNELAAALGDDANFSTTVTNSIAAKAPLAGPTFTGNIQAGEKVGIGRSPLAELDITGTGEDISVRIDAPTGYDAELKFANNGSTAFTLGHDDATDNFVIGTANVDTNQRFVIDSSGNVGIGTTSPASLLHVDKSFSGTLVTLHQTAGASSSDRGLDVETSSTGTTVQRWFNSGTELMRVGGNGNVGIGTNSPSDRLVVQKDTSNIEPILVLKNDNTTDDNGISIDFSGKDTGGNNILYGRIAAKYTNHATEKSHMIFTHRNNSGSFDEWMRVTHDGYVGIGTDSPIATFHVETSTNSPGLFKSTYSGGGYIEYKLGASGANLGYLGSASQLISGGSATQLGIRSQGDVSIATGGNTERFRIESSGHIHGQILSNSNSNPLGSGTNSGKLWSTSGNWINVWYVGNDPYGIRYFYELDIQGLFGYTSYGEIYKDRSGRWHVLKHRSAGTDIQVEGTNNYIQVNQNSGANQTNSAGNLTLVRAPGTT